MTNTTKSAIAFNSDMNNKELINVKKVKRSYHIGQIKELHMVNFMCYKNFSIQFHPTHMQIVTGANGSGKSTIANAMCLCLGAQARTTGRTANVQSFIRKGETSAELTVILANEGEEAYKPELYGNEIRIKRKIGNRQSSYKIQNRNGNLISTHKETVDEIIQALSISPENPLCVLHQEISKTFLINSHAGKKYQFYMKVSQLDQIKQAYEQGIYTIQLLTQRVNAMKQKHISMLKELIPLENGIKNIEIRRDYEKQKYDLGSELHSARMDGIQQELFELQDELDEIQKTKDNTDSQILEEQKEANESDRLLNEYSTEKSDLEKDLQGLRELSKLFSKNQQNIQSKVDKFTHQCQEFKQILTDIELEQVHVQKQIDEYENLNQQLNNHEKEYLNIDHEISLRQNKQIEWDKLFFSLINDMNINDENIREKQLTRDILENELIQKQQDLDQFRQIDQDKTNGYAPWMSDCLKTIQNDQRFHKQPIGPISRYVHCINSHWSYAVEKHLAPIMSSFICTDTDDEKLLLEILSSYSSEHRPAIYVRKYSDQIHDISGTREYIQQANLLTIYDVLKIDNITVECALIDFKQIEVTILVENLDEIKQYKQTGILKWKNIDRKVKQVVEAWTADGSNIKLDGTFRIYTNVKQPLRYFLSNNVQSLLDEELKCDIKILEEQIEQIDDILNQLKIIQETKTTEINQIKKSRIDNKKKLRDLMMEHDRFNSTMPIILDCSLNELQEKAQNSLLAYNNTIQKYDEIKQKQEKNHQHLIDITKNLENITQKIDRNTQQYDLLMEKYQNEQSKRYEINQKLTKLTKKSIQLNEEIRQYQNKLEQLKKSQSKKSKKYQNNIRSIREIQQEFDAINSYLQANKDTNEIRREIIHQYRLKRDAAKEYKQAYERCYQQIDRLEQFIHKRQQGFVTIADRHQYFLRIKFQNLMKKYHFDESDIKIDHKKEELHIIIKNYHENLSPLSGGERSISTVCFLLALWETIYQPFRLLDEIDIYMDNEKLNSTLNILYENTFNYSTSQHIIFTPQIIDSKFSRDFNVPVFNMPTPKRLLDFTSEI